MKRMTWFGSVVALSLVSAAALAQDSGGHFDPTPYDFTFRVGVVWPGTDPIRAMENNWLNFGMDFRFPKQYFKTSDTYFSVDYISKSWSGAHGSFWPIMINQRFYTGTYGEDGRTYYSLGIGVVMFDVFDSDTVFGGKLGAGVEFGKHIVFEGNYYLSDGSNGNVRAQSLGVSLGYRF